jgi:hypothetical protein
MNNAVYYHAAYGVAITVYALYAIALWRRRSRVRAEIARMEGGDR